MLRRRDLLSCAIFAISMLSATSASAQYAEIKVEHDWTITLFGGRFGYEQMVITPYGDRFARLYWGGGTIPVNTRSGTRGLLLPIGLSLAVAAIVVWRVRARRRVIDPPAPARAHSTSLS